VFDELVNFPEFRAHEIKALHELILQNGLHYEWLGTACGVDTVMGMPLGWIEGDGTCLAAAVRIVSA